MIWNHGLGRQFTFLAIFLLFHILSAAAEVDTRLVNALAGEDAVARFMAEERLVQMGDAAIPALEPLATSSGFAPARQYAINVLAQIGSEQAVHLLLRILEEEPDVMVRALICRHLGRLGVEEAVPIIGKWLFTIRGKAFDYGGEPQVVNLWYAWAVHVHALREIGSEKGIPVLEEMLSVDHGGRAGREFTNTYRENLRELTLEAAFWRAVRQVSGLESQTEALFLFFRRDTLAFIRLYRDKVIHLGAEGRWTLEGMRNHPDEGLQQAAMSLLEEYDRLKLMRDEELGKMERDSDVEQR